MPTTRLTCQLHTPHATLHTLHANYTPYMPTTHPTCHTTHHTPSLHAGHMVVGQADAEALYDGDLRGGGVPQAEVVRHLRHGLGQRDDAVQQLHAALQLAGLHVDGGEVLQGHVTLGVALQRLVDAGTAPGMSLRQWMSSMPRYVSSCALSASANIASTSSNCSSSIRIWPRMSLISMQSGYFFAHSLNSANTLATSSGCCAKVCRR